MAMQKCSRAESQFAINYLIIGQQAADLKHEAFPVNTMLDGRHSKHYPEVRSNAENASMP